VGKLRPEDADCRHTVGEIGVAAAIAPGFGRPDALFAVGRGKHSGCFQSADQEIALGVEVGSDMVRDLAGVVAEADAAVEARRAAL